MLTTRIPKGVSCHQVLDYIDHLSQLDIIGIELDIQTYGGDELVVCSHFEEARVAHLEEETLHLSTVFAHFINEKSTMQIILNLKEPYLENRAKTLVEKWGLKKQVLYSGNLKPALFTPWDKPYVIYNIENCLPNVYKLETLKRAHFDVIHYFCNKYKIQTIRVHIKALTEEIFTWSDALNLKLSVYGIQSMEKAKGLLEAGVEYVATTDTCVADDLLATE